MAQLRFSVGDVRGAFKSNVDAMAKAATAAMAETANAAKLAGRASIASAGFGARWQNSLRANTYPSSGTSLSPAALIYDRIQYSEIFQTGGKISGDLLWLPIEANLPGGKWTASKYAATIGPLMSVNRPGHPPLLFAKGKRGPPLFVGVSEVTLKKRLNVDEAVASEAARLPDRYAAKLKES